LAQILIVYTVVAIAAGWIGWSMFLRGWFKRRAWTKSGAACGPHCNCGD
jgi:hypothetical protein